MNPYLLINLLSMVITRHIPLYRSAGPVWQPCCSSRSAVGAPPSCGPCASSSINWPRTAGRCCAPSGVRCVVYRVWRSRLRLGWTLLPTVQTQHMIACMKDHELCWLQMDWLYQTSSPVITPANKACSLSTTRQPFVLLRNTQERTKNGNSWTIDGGPKAQSAVSAVAGCVPHLSL